jgi:hypothetical protein
LVLGQLHQHDRPQERRGYPNWDWLRVDIEQLIDAQGDEECEMAAMGNIDSSIVERAEWVRSL